MKCSIKVYSPAGLPGVDLLDTPIWNKGTAFDEAERAAFGLRELLPPHIESLEQQSIRAYEGFKAKTADLERHIYVRQLEDNNETLFYPLLHASVQVSQSPGRRSWTSRLFLFSRDGRR
jgi:malate dehydrogenase (oxaloacetate-decarboxylating)